MPEAIAAACSAVIAPSGSSAMMVTASLAGVELAGGHAAEFEKILLLEADGLPAPITIRR